MLAALAEGGWIGADARDDLDAAYRFLRAGRAPPADGGRRADPHAAVGPRGARALRALRRLRGPRRLRRASCSSICARCSANTCNCSRTTPAPGRRARSRFPKDADDRETLDRLGAMGFRKPLEVSATRARAGSPALPRRSRANSRAQQLTELVPVLLDRLARSENPDAALVAFDQFLAGLHGGGRLFSLLRQNPDLVALVALMLGTAPRLADILAQYPAGDGRAARADILRRAAGRGQARGGARQRSLGAGDVLRGFSRPPADVQPGADVPDRRAHSVRNGDRPSRPAAPSRGSPMS